MKMRGADVVARTLAAAGTRYVFTLSGNHIMPVFDAVLEAKLPLIHVRHEAAAVHMADAWGRLTGEAGIALVTGGPGHANAVAALYTALGSESPMVLISGHAPLAELGRSAFQEMRQAEIAAPLTKASWTAQSAQTLGADIARAIREARSGRPGPVHLSVPNDVLDAVVDATVPSREWFSPPGDSMEEGTVNEYLDALSKSKKPLVIAGPAMMNARGRERARKLEEATGVPVIGMESPRGVNDPSLGRLAKVLGEADAVWLAGKRRDFTLKFGKVFAPDCKLMETETFPSLLPAGKRQTSAWREEVHAALRYRPAEWATLRSKPGGPVHPAELCRAVQKLLEAPDAVLICDGGEFGQWAQACLSAPHRVINGPAGAIGVALPFAAAAALAMPKSRVVAMMGDGSFGFHMSEIDTAVRYKLPYVTVVGNDHCWNAEHQIQLRAYGKDRAHSLDLLPTPYGAVAAAMGAHGEDVSRPDQLETALRSSEKSGKVSCINVAVERLPAPAY
jgi:acetolactate synthase-1/2/3 large subunit